MKPIITVHRGELLQIKRMIENGDLRGDMYGLRTESRQPVIQFVCGENNKSNNTTERESTCQDMLKNRHGLLKLGEWVVSKRNVSRKDVVLFFNKEGELIFAEDRGQECTIDILKGQSAFRLYEPLTKVLPDLSVPIPTEEYDKENENKEAEVTKEQWYSEPDGVKLLQGIYATFPQKGLTILNMSRDKATEDISLSLTVDSMPIAVYFPASFPYENPKARVDDENDWSEVDLQYEEGMPPEEAVPLLCALLLNLVSDEENKRQLRKQERKNNKQNQKLKAEKIPKRGGLHSEQNQTPSMSDAQRNQDEPSTGQKQPQLTGEHEQRNQDEPSTGQKQPQLKGEHEQRNQDEPSTEQKQPQLTGEHEQRSEDEPSEQEHPSPTFEHDQQHQNQPFPGQEQVTTPRNKTDEVTEQTPDENMDIDLNLEKQQKIDEDMEIDDEDQQNISTKF
ncbi:uncharacterized protein LOC116301201 isoform X5 [Actinia tenebrosa]|uniref:Uncharacterized protein LOC116301201 isoform X3 n=1 Tax=Actinia tenebrosa TaxID=6105 RepID=A0A6P8IH42_ACTTE|nr:uncharacterized protein LOC116301201 isoform X3 [Actinia tenebrosa]XP_031566086.1 uncharacterized protein LOC116301201 isoform X5 [Actinia tenebrosa]